MWTGFLVFSAFRNTAGLSVIWFQDHIFFFFFDQLVNTSGDL